MSDEELEFPPVPLSPSLPSDFLDPEFATKYETSPYSSNARPSNPEVIPVPPKPVMSAARASFASKITRGSQSALKSSASNAEAPKPALAASKHSAIANNPTIANKPTISKNGHLPPPPPSEVPSKLANAEKSLSNPPKAHSKPAAASTTPSASPPRTNPPGKLHSAPDPPPRVSQLAKTQAGSSVSQERKAFECKQRMSAWIERARRKKHDSDFANAERNHVLSILLAIDALVCFMVAFDYEDRADACRTHGHERGKPLHARSWQTLVPFLAKIATKAEQIDSDLAGVCYFVGAVVGLHVSYLQRRLATPETHTRDLHQALSDFRRALRLLPNDVVRTRYGMDHRSGWAAVQIDAHRPDPVHNRAVLPLHVNSSLPEAAAFALNVARQWAAQEGVDYAWDAEKRD